MSTPTVVVTGIGFASCIGTSRQLVTDSLRNLRHGFVRKVLAGGASENGPELVHGQVDNFDVSSTNPLEWTFPGDCPIPPDQVKSLPPHGPFVIHALNQALAEAGIDEDCLGHPDTGLFCASTGSPRLLHHHLSRMESADWQRAHPLGVVSSVAGCLNFNLASHYGITGANCGFVSACTSSSHALGHAFDEIILGRQQRMLVVAGEDGNAESLLPFQGMRALSQNPDPDTASRPFDRQRDGFVGSGGGVAMILESSESAERRDAHILAIMSGWAQASDGYSIAAPHPEGRGLKNAMQLCLDRTGSQAADIDWVCAHATSTPAGDRAETLALTAAGFDREDSPTKISSIKGITGHGLSHSGLLEAAVCVLALDQSLLPGNAALADPDPVCQNLNLPTRTEPQKLHRVLNNSSGFGGSNVCHIFEKPD
jgi:3-oxoacyl-(acyl-carrier-protein) synthase